MKQKNPFSPETLKWARESSNILLDEVAHRMKKAPEVIAAWESGEESPTYIQLEKLAYEIYKRPLAVFFFPEPPEEMTPGRSFRTLPASELEELPPSFLQVFREAQAMQMNLEELADGVNPASRRIVEDISIHPDTHVSEVVRRVRDYLGISIETQTGWKDTETALRRWRGAIQGAGVFVFKDAFKCDDVSGFCVYDVQFPIIYINNSMPKTRQVFTLFHELIHLLLKTGGIDKVHDDYIARTKGAAKKIEVLCNRFAGEFLVPNSRFSRDVRGIRIDDNAIQGLAARYKVSREVILRKCLDKGLIDQHYYEHKAAEWTEQAMTVRTARTGGNYYATKATYLGDSYLNLVFQKYYQKRFSLGQLAEYLTVKVKSLPGLETAFLGRG